MWLQLRAEGEETSEEKQVGAVNWWVCSALILLETKNFKLQHFEFKGRKSFCFRCSKTKQRLKGKMTDDSIYRSLHDNYVSNKGVGWLQRIYFALWNHYFLHWILCPTNLIRGGPAVWHWLWFWAVWLCSALFLQSLCWRDHRLQKIMRLYLRKPMGSTSLTSAGNNPKNLVLHAVS